MIDLPETTPKFQIIKVNFEFFVAIPDGIDASKFFANLVIDFEDSAQSLTKESNCGLTPIKHTFEWIKND